MFAYYRNIMSHMLSASQTRPPIGAIDRAALMLHFLSVFLLLGHADGLSDVAGENGAVLGMFTSELVDICLERAAILHLGFDECIPLVLITLESAPSLSFIFTFDLRMVA